MTDDFINSVIILHCIHSGDHIVTRFPFSNAFNVISFGSNRYDWPEAHIMTIGGLFINPLIVRFFLNSVTLLKLECFVRSLLKHIFVSHYLPLTIARVSDILTNVIRQCADSQMCLIKSSFTKLNILFSKAQLHTGCWQQRGR